MELIDFGLTTALPRLGDQIRSNPYAFAAGCVAFIPVAVWVISMINWMIMGEIDGIFGTLSISVAIALGYFTAAPPRPELAPLFLLGILAMICLWPVIKSSADLRLNHVARLDELDRAYERLSLGKRDPGALFKLAAACHSLKMRGPAIVIAEEVLPKLDPKYFADQHRLYQEWKSIPPYPGMFAPTKCPNCRVENGPGLPFCPHCGEPQYLTIAERGWKPNSLTFRVLGAWMAGTAVLVMIPVIGASSWPVPLKLSLIVLLVVVAAYALIRAFVKVAQDAS